MALTQAIAAGSVQLWKLRLLGRMQVLARETGGAGFLLPVAILLLADEANGGPIGAADLRRCFALADFEARDLIDCYFPGWWPAPGPADPVRNATGATLRFDPRSCEGFRQALLAAGIRPPGSKAGLILVDASHMDGSVKLAFPAAIGIDLAAAALPHPPSSVGSVGALLSAMVDTIAAVRSRESLGPGYAFTLSQQLGLAVAKRSFLEAFLADWSARPGAGQVATHAVTNLGPELRLLDL
jgi:hypothetical protein